MKKTVKLVCLVAFALLAFPQDADAQFFKKLKEAAKEVVKDATTPATQTPGSQQAPAAQFVSSASGVSISNPGAQYFDIDFVEAIGNAAANTVTITLKATAKDLNYSNVRIGDNNVVAYDGDGNEYKTNNYAESKNMMTGVPVKFILSPLVNVPAKVTTLSIVSVGWFINSAKSSKAGSISTSIQLKGVPVKWQ